MLRILIRLVILVMPLLPVAGQAQDTSSEGDTMPRCGPQMDGQVYCRFGTLYECQLISPNATERRTGWRWKVDILRACSEPSPAKTDESLSEIGCGPERTDLLGTQRSGGGARASGEAGGRSQEGTMYIRPDGCLISRHGR
jgi:hypothetical protein